MTSLIEQFATQHRVRIRRDSCSFPIIPGKLTCVGVKPETGIRVESRSHIYEHDDKTLGVCLLFSSARMWNASKRAMLAAGFILRQDGYAEGTATFDPTDPSQSKLALFL